MNVELDADDVSALVASLRRMGLVGADEAPRLTPLTGGVSSQIVRADTARGTVCIKRALARLKVAAQWLAPLDRNTAEVAWMRFASTLVPGFVPQIIAEDQTARAFAMAYLDPENYRVWKDELLAGNAKIFTARQLGARLAAIHQASAGKCDLAQSFANDASFFALRLEPYFLAAAEANPDCAAELIQLSDDTAATKRALVHGDVSPKNILIGSAGPVLLDAECAWYGDPAFDIAFCLTHLLLKCLQRPEATARFLACFDAFNDAYFAGVAWENPADVEARAARLLPALMLARVDGKSPVEYLKTPEDLARVRSFTKPFIVDPPKTLDAIRNRWNKERA
ncbi:aminoglycoside phosphotransferase family protein [Paraburkholderia fungorum]|jgi:aminoglycoside phosphotransferase (APT) family kinase protein|uniref:phosphotransferase family protein n=1 Tax=Paraburkholderia fungorum TaxID=134537 RepID=UPI0038B7413F